MMEIADLHCVICFDAFCPHDRPPLVLPCGHTYVCSPCASRLDVCMHCRLPLRASLPPASEGCVPVAGAGGGKGSGPSSSGPPGSEKEAAGTGTGTWTAAAASSSSSWWHPRQPHPAAALARGQRKRPQGQPPPQTVPLPTPKNLVILELMEVAERQRRAREEREKEEEEQAPTPSHMDEADDAARSDQRQDDGAGGGEEGEGEGGGAAAYDLAAAYLSGEGGGSPGGSSSGRDEQFGIRSALGSCGTYAVRDYVGLMVHPVPVDGVPYRIGRGQTVQVTHVMEGGAAHLAGGLGVIFAQSDQLVKVGAARDQACQIEGMLRTLGEVRREHREKLEQLARLEEGLKLELEGTVRDGVGIWPIIEPAPDAEDQDEDEKEDVGSSARALVGLGGLAGIDAEPGRTTPSTSSVSASPQWQLGLTPQAPPSMDLTPDRSSDINLPDMYSKENNIHCDDSVPFDNDNFLPPPPPLTVRQESSNLSNNMVMCGFLEGTTYQGCEDEGGLVGFYFDGASGSFDQGIGRSSDATSRVPTTRQELGEREGRGESSPGAASERPRIRRGRGGSLDSFSESRIDVRTGYSSHNGALGHTGSWRRDVSTMREQQQMMSNTRGASAIRRMRLSTNLST